MDRTSAMLNSRRLTMSWRITRRSGEAPAFTLVDLLVAVGITAAIAVVICPVFVRARDSERGKWCMMGNRQFNRSMIMYSQDYDGKLTRGIPFLVPYVQTGVYRCPDTGDLVLSGVEAEAKWWHGYRPRRPHPLDFAPNQVYSGGPIMTSAVVQAIFWGTKWSDNTYAQDKITGLDTWYQGIGGSGYARSVYEYTGINGRVGPNVTYLGHIIDTSNSTPATDPIIDNTALMAEICSKITNPVPNGYYPVYVSDFKVEQSAGYCAFHFFGRCNGTIVQYGYFPDQDTANFAGCATVNGSGQNYTPDLVALADVSGHELSEARTDPQPNSAWTSPLLGEVGDACVSNVAPAIYDVPFVTLSNGAKFTIQGEWSNNAYDIQQGYDPGTGFKGCVAGTKYRLF